MIFKIFADFLLLLEELVLFILSSLYISVTIV